MTSHSNSFIFLGAAVVGIVSAAGMYLVEHLRHERRRHAMAQNLVRIDQQLACMQQELEQLRKLQKDKNAVRLRKSRTKSTASSVISEDTRAATDLESSDLEFYDVSDEETTVTPIEETLRLIDEKLNGDSVAKYREAYDRLNDLCLESPEDPQLLWRLGKSNYKLASTTNETGLKNTYIQNGIETCQSALKIDANTGEAHKWLASLIGVRSTQQPIKEKISDGYLFKQHLDKAVEFLPTDGGIRHMLGRFAYETASLKWYERKVAATFFAEPPSATYDEALNYFIDAEKLTKNSWKENKLYIAKCQIALGKYKEAVGTLEAADGIKSVDDLASAVDSEVQVLLQKYNSYG